jgi:hypothetical protein
VTRREGVSGIDILDGKARTGSRAVLKAIHRQKLALTCGARTCEI